MRLGLSLGALLVSAPMVWGQDVSFKELAKATKKHSPILQKETVQVQISHQEIVKSKSVYYPTLKLGMNTEYSKRFQENGNSLYIGEESLTQATRYQNSATLSLSYDLFRFGARRQGVEAAIAKADVTAFGKCLVEKELLLRLLSIYHQLRLNQQKQRQYEQLSLYYTDLYQIAKRLYNSGFLGQMEVMHYAKQIADTRADLEDVKEKKGKLLAEVTYISGVSLKTTTHFLPLEKLKDLSSPPTFSNTLKARQLFATIRQKKAEYSMAKTNHLPKISFYGKYDFYGQDLGHFRKSVNDLEKNGYRFGLSFSWNLFDGFAKEATVATKMFELQQAHIALEEAKREFIKEWTLLEGQKHYYETTYQAAKEAGSIASEVVHIGEKLYKNGEVDKMTDIQNTILELESSSKAKEAQEKHAFKLYEENLSIKRELQCAAH